MDRRQFLKYGSGGFATLLFSGTGARILTRPKGAPPQAVDLTLFVVDVSAQMVDRKIVRQWAYSTIERPTGVFTQEHPAVPGPVILAQTGDHVRISVTNTLDERHGFAIPGATGDVLDLLPGVTGTLDFVAGEGGTYLYFDQLNAPVNRVVGLHGALVIMPTDTTTPYTFPTQAVRRLFDDLGAVDTRFNFIDCEGQPRTGKSWDPDRQRIWLFSQIDPGLNEIVVRAGAPAIDPVVFRRRYLPRYFSINGRSGFFAAHDHDTAAEGAAGEPMLLRMLNAGLTTHSAHIHGNHVFDLSLRDNQGHLTIHDNLFERDATPMPPLEIKDTLLPFEVPRDIYPWPPRNLAQFRQQLPLSYAMHCHTEMSQSAGGGMYPHGLIAHWAITEI
jgi:FtsP/CotA-like multicopper oxidase with cupredoxin domain